MNITRPKSHQPIPDHAKKVFKGILFDVYQWEQELFDGTKKIFEKVKRRDTVIVFAVLPDGKILLTEQEQPGKAPFIAATGGIMEDNEDALVAAKRELLEESGYEAEEFLLWDSQQPVSKVDWAVYTFIAKGLKKVSDLNLDGGEKIKAKPVTFDELLEIGTQSGFSESEVIPYFYEAKLNPEKKEELKKLFGLL